MSEAFNILVDYLSGRRAQAEKPKRELLSDISKFNQAYDDLIALGDTPKEWHLSTAADVVAMRHETFWGEPENIPPYGMVNTKMLSATVVLSETLGDGMAELIGQAGNRITFQVSRQPPPQMTRHIR